MKKTVPLLSIIFCLNVSAQNTFQKAFGGIGAETGTCIQNTLDGNYIISGYTNSFTSPFRDAYLIKTDTAGNILWSATYGGGNDEVCYYVALVNTGGYVLTGATNSFGAGGNDAYLIRTDGAGNMVWSAVAGGQYDDYGWAVAQSADRGYLVSGFSETCLGGCSQGLLVKTDSSGTIMWTKLLGDSGFDALYGISRTSDNGFIVTGATSSNSFGSSDTWLIRLNAIGDTLWTRFYGTPFEESGAVARQTGDGGFIVTGDIHNAFNIHHASLLKTDSAGNLQWIKTFGTPDTTGGGEFGWDVHQLPDRGYILLGSTPNYGNSMQVFIVRTDSAGNMQWSKAYGGSQVDDPWYSILTADGGLAVTGATFSFGSGQSDIYFLKIDSLGYANGCNDSAIVPQEVTPVLQTGGGTIITTGVISSNPLMLSNNPSTAAINICQPVGINEKGFDVRNVHIYPNPFSESATIDFNTELRIKNAELKLYDLMGKEILVSEVLAPHSRLERGSLQSGMYFYRLTGDSGQGKKEIIGTGKIIIE